MTLQRTAHRPRRARWPAAAAAMALLACAGAAHPQTAGERESLEALRRTTLALVEALVQSGVLRREQADALVAESRRQQAQWGTPPTQAAPPAAAASGAPPVVRVPYVPPSVRDRIRDEVREEVIARARAERWGVPNATAEWTDRIAIEGDLRLRQQGDRMARDNPSPTDFLTGSLAGATRAPDFAAGTAAGLPTGSTQDDRDRLRLRARLGIQARVAEGVTAGLRLSTGSATDRVSTNQTLGQNFNRYSFLLDQAFVRLDPADWISASAGRIPNPWFSTDMVWSDNLSFEGLAASVRRPASAAAQWLPFATLGYFPVRESTGTRRSRAISGAQLGVQWEYSERSRFKFAVAQYVFNGFEGRIDPDYDLVGGAGRSYGQFEYEAGLRQRGNTLFLTNNPLELQAGLTPDKARWGLASRFRPLTVTAAAEFSHFAPVIVGLSGEAVLNRAYSRQEVLERTGLGLNDARIFGFTLRGTVGSAAVRNAGDWQAGFSYRWLGSDAVPDAFVDGDLGGGGTNVRGITAGFTYGLARDTDLGLRYLSGRTISSPTVQQGLMDRYGVDALQVDLHVRF